MSSFLSYALFYTFFYLAFLPRGLCEGGGGGSSGNAYMYGGEGAKFTWALTNDLYIVGHRYF